MKILVFWLVLFLVCEFIPTQVQSTLLAGVLLGDYWGIWIGGK